MEVLNSLWNLLITENEMLTKIITAPTVFIEVWIAYQLYSVLLNLNTSKKKEFLYIFIVSSISLFFEFIIPAPFNTFLNYILLFILTKKFLSLSTLKTILLIILPIIIFAVIGTLTLNPYLKILDITSETMSTTPIYQLTYLCNTYILAFLIIKIIELKNLKFSIIENLTASNKYIININLCLGIITIVIQAIITYYYVSILPIFITTLNLILLCSYFLVSFYSLTRTMKLQIATIKLENAESYNKTLSFLYDNVKAFKHDFDNMLFTIGGFIDNEDISGLKTYYNSLENECQTINNISLLNPTLINNPGIYNLLTAKYQKAKTENVAIKLEFFFDLTKLHMPIYDFSRMLGIFLDNAIEAAAESDEKVIKIIFRDSLNFNMQIVQIENSYVNKSIDTKIIFNKGVTEKKNHTGMGLWEVRQILKRNNNVNLTTENNETYFKQYLEIYY